MLWNRSVIAASMVANRKSGLFVINSSSVTFTVSRKKYEIRLPLIYLYYHKCKHATFSKRHPSKKVYVIVHFDHKKLNLDWKCPILFFMKFTLALLYIWHSFHLALIPFRQTPRPGRTTATSLLPLDTSATALVCISSSILKCNLTNQKNIIIKA